MVTLYEVITYLFSRQISISSCQSHNVMRCGRSQLTSSFFFLNDPPTTEISPLPLHAALPISLGGGRSLDLTPRVSKIGASPGTIDNVCRGLSAETDPARLKLNYNFPASLREPVKL